MRAHSATHCVCRQWHQPLIMELQSVLRCMRFQWKNKLSRKYTGTLKPACLLIMEKPLTLFTELLVFMLITLCEYGNCSQNIKPTQITTLHSIWSTSIRTRCTHEIQYLKFFFQKINTAKLSSILYCTSFFSLSLSLWKWTSRRTCTVVRNTKHTLYLFFSLSKGVCLNKKNWGWRNGMMS